MAYPLSSLDCHNMGFQHDVGEGCMGHIFSQNVVHIGGETKKQQKLVKIVSNQHFWPL